MTKWLTSDEVRSYWLEFKRDCLSKVNMPTLTGNTTTTATNSTTTATDNSTPRP